MPGTMEQPGVAEQIMPGTPSFYTSIANLASELVGRFDGFAAQLEREAIQGGVEHDDVATAEHLTPGTTRYYAAMAEQLFELVGRLDGFAAQLEQEAAATRADNVMSQFSKLSASERKGEASLTPLFIGFAGSETEQVLQEVNRRFGIDDLRETPAQIVSGPAGAEPTILHELGLGAGIKLRLALEREPDGRQFMILAAYKQEQTTPETPQYEAQQKVKGREQEQRATQPQVQAAVDTARDQFAQLISSASAEEAALTSTPLFFGFVDNNVSEPALAKINEMLGIPDLRTMPPQIVSGLRGEEPAVLYQLDTGTGLLFTLEVERTKDGRQVMGLYGYNLGSNRLI